MKRTCAWCSGPMPERARSDAITCSTPCRQARHRAARWAAPVAPDVARDGCAAAPHDGSGEVLHDGCPPGARDGCAGSARRLAYADPPYPGKSRRYYGEHPDYAGEVDHEALLSRVATYDAWALSTSAAALPQVLAAAVAQGLPVRVASWTRGARPHATARYPVSSWEPVLYVPLPSRDAGTRRVDSLVHGVTPLATLPTRVVGAKPPAFCRWVFDLLGAQPGDTLDDLFPGSGIVAMTWDLFTQPSRATAVSTALPAPEPALT